MWRIGLDRGGICGGCGAQLNFNDSLPVVISCGWATVDCPNCHFKTRIVVVDDVKRPEKKEIE